MDHRLGLVEKVRRGIRPGVLRVVSSLAERLGFVLVRDDYYSPMPVKAAIPEERWADSGRVAKLGLDLDGAAAFLTGKLAPFISEFREDGPGSAGSGFELRNGTYESGDADVLYAMLRLLEPATVIEFGSGVSTHLISAASSRSTEPFRHVVFDPYPSSASSTVASLGLPAGVTLVERAVESLGPADIADLQPGDVLFIDTTHTVKTGGDCENIFLELLPSVPEGVFIHVHDVFTPFDYPRKWIMELDRAWAEQYLLEAFLMFNEEFEVVLPFHALTRLRPDAVRSAIPHFDPAGLGPAVSPGAFWFVRTSPGERFLD